MYIEFKEGFFKEVYKERKVSIESRLLYAFIMCELVWASICAIVFLAIGHIPAAVTFVILIFGVMLGTLITSISKKKEIAKELFMILSLIVIPLIWYVAGGNKSSANALFVLEPILFTMTNRGVRQKVYIILSMLSTSVIYVLSERFPWIFSGFKMTDNQHYIASVCMGSTIVLWVSFLIMYSKNEYQYENSRVIETTEQLKRSNQMQKNFLANMSHEIRSPLGIVLGFNNLIKDSDSLEQVHEYSDNISSAGKTLQTVINDILDYSKIEAGKLDIIENDYSLPELLNGIQHDINLRCEEKGLEFVVNEKSDLPQYLFGDNIRIKQCLLNLLSNSVKYTDKGTVTLDITNEITEAGLNRLTFVVRDTGRGISDEALPKLFTSFQRLDEGHNRGIEGTGLGLAITKSLLDEMGGSIKVTSKLGEGSTFSITLEQKNGSLVNNRSYSGDVAPDLSGISILAVDDTELNLKLISKLLSKDGAQIKCVGSGMEAVAEASKTKYDLILMDHMMPEMDGVEAFGIIKKECMVNKDTPVVMLTANAMVSVEQEYLSMGFSGYVSKPINGKELKEKIYHLVKSK